MAENILEKIIEKKKEKIENLKRTVYIESLNDLIDKNIGYLDFKGKIQTNLKNKKFSLVFC